jgi:DNA-binding transcriptional MerR regulator
MDVRQTALELAFSLADTGMSLAVIREALKRQGHDQSHLNSPTIRKQLAARAAAARAAT